MKTASEMTYIVSSGALNSTPTNNPMSYGYDQNNSKNLKVRVHLVQWTDTTDRISFSAKITRSTIMYYETASNLSKSV